ncbi:hypothetical protein Pelo_12405 [Pelomyxa schiedti]|nr:hypothetical protein Pelo_12405 [Pelomyxa schiedti]
MPSFLFYDAGPRKTERRGALLTLDDSATVGDALHRLQGEFGGDGAGFGLYIAGTEEQKSRWLLTPETPLASCSLEEEKPILYLRTQRKQKVRNVDGNTTTEIIDLTVPIKNTVTRVLSYLNVVDTDEYSFQCCERQWVPNNFSLIDVDVPEDEVLNLKRKFWVSYAKLKPTDPDQYIDMIFFQVREAVIVDARAVPSKPEAISIAALDLAVRYGTLDAYRHTLQGCSDKEFKRLQKEFLKKITLAACSSVTPCWKDSAKALVADIVKEYQTLSFPSMRDTKIAYVNKAMSTPSFGASVFVVEVPPRHEFLAITKEAILRIDLMKVTLIKSIAWSSLKRWGFASDIFTVECDSSFSAMTKDSKQINKVCNAMLQFIKEETIRSQMIDGANIEPLTYNPQEVITTSATSNTSNQADTSFFDFNPVFPSLDSSERDRSVAPKPNTTISQQQPQFPTSFPTGSATPSPEPGGFGEDFDPFGLKAKPGTGTGTGTPESPRALPTFDLFQFTANLPRDCSLSPRHSSPLRKTTSTSTTTSTSLSQTVPTAPLLPTSPRQTSSTQSILDLLL